MVVEVKLSDEYISNGGDIYVPTGEYRRVRMDEFYLDNNLKVCCMTSDCYSKNHFILEPKRWRAVCGGGYWAITDTFQVEKRYENDGPANHVHYDNYNYFKTSRDAIEVANKLKDSIKEIVNGQY